MESYPQNIICWSVFIRVFFTAFSLLHYFSRVRRKIFISNFYFHYPSVASAEILLRGFSCQLYQTTLLREYFFSTATELKSAPMFPFPLPCDCSTEWLFQKVEYLMWDSSWIFVSFPECVSLKKIQNNLDLPHPLRKVKLNYFQLPCFTQVL